MRRIFPHLAIFSTLPTFLFAQAAPAPENKEGQGSLVSNEQTVQATLPDQSKGYVINFTNVSLIEYIRFVSRISNRNFLFQEIDLPYTVTIVSEEPTSVNEIIATLIQILRVHGLEISEQGTDLIIYRGTDLSRIATVLDNQNNPTNAPLVTRILRMLYLTPDRTKMLIQPMLSSKALIESVPETGHLIITDLALNVDKVVQLLKTIDTPNTAIDVAIYTPEASASNALLPIALSILNPIAAAETTPLSIVEQPATNTLFIVSSADIIEKSLAVLQLLDKPGTETGGGMGTGTGGAVAVATYTPKHLSPTALIDLAERILEPIALSEKIPFTMVQQAATRLIFITSTPSFNKRAVEVLNVLDQSDGAAESLRDVPGSSPENTFFYVYRLQHQNGRDIRQQLVNLGSSSAGGGGGESSTPLLDRNLITTLRRAVWIDSTNSLLFIGSESSLRKIRQLLPQLDVINRQVYIEVLVIETTLHNSLDFGVQWGSRITDKGFEASNGLFAAPNLLPGDQVSNRFLPQFQSPPTPGTIPRPNIPLSNGFNFGAVGNFLTHNGTVFGSIGALLNALQGEVNTKVIMNPKIIAQDNTKASVFVGQNIPYTTSTVQIVASNNSTGFTLQYLDVGINLQVTPILGEGNIVNLQIQQTITEVEGTQSISSGGNAFPVPTTSKVDAQTQVNVPDGFFLVMSGMIQNKRNYAKSGFPCLGWLPCVGAAFSEQIEANSKRNTIIFLHPRIIDTPERMTCITDVEGREFNLNSIAEECPWTPFENPFYKDYSPICPHYNPAADRCGHRAPCDQ